MVTYYSTSQRYVHFLFLSEFCSRIGVSQKWSGHQSSKGILPPEILLWRGRQFRSPRGNPLILPRRRISSVSLVYVPQRSIIFIHTKRKWQLPNILESGLELYRSSASYSLRPWCTIKSIIAAVDHRRWDTVPSPLSMPIWITVCCELLYMIGCRELCISRFDSYQLPSPFQLYRADLSGQDTISST